MASKINSFEDLIIWQKAQDIAARIYILADTNEFIKKDFSLRNQLKTASLSISDNIAEGFEYNNNADFNRYLRISKGSCGELRNKILFIKRKNFIVEQDAKEIGAELKILGKQIGSLMAKIKAKLAAMKKPRKQ